MSAEEFSGGCAAKRSQRAHKLCEHVHARTHARTHEPTHEPTNARTHTRAVQVGSIDVVVTIEPSVLRREAFPRQLLAASPFDDAQAEDDDAQYLAVHRRALRQQSSSSSSSSSQNVRTNTPKGHSKLRRASASVTVEGIGDVDVGIGGTGGGAGHEGSMENLLARSHTLTELTVRLSARHRRRNENMGEIAHTMRVFSFPSGHSLRIMQALSLIHI